MRGGTTAAGRASTRTVALVVSALVHAVLLVLLLRHLTQAPTYAEAPIVQVTLVPATRAQAEPRETRRRLPAREPARQTTVAPRIAVPQPDVAPITPGPAMGDDPSVRARQALRGLAGCERPGLSREERERCETRRWAATQPPARLNLDPSGRYVESPEPFLSRRPTKGCRARAAGDVDSMGETGNVRGGVTCVVPF